MSNYNAETEQPHSKGSSKSKRNRDRNRNRGLDKAHEVPDSTIFTNAWSLLHNVYDGISQPMTLVRPVDPELDESNPSDRADTSDAESRATTPGFSVADNDRTEFDSTETGFHVEDSANAPISVYSPLPPGPPRRKSLIMTKRSQPLSQQSSSSGINCILEIDDLGATRMTKGTHRSNQAESSAHEYQQLLDGVKARPKPSKFMDYSCPVNFMPGARASKTAVVPTQSNQSGILPRMVSKEYLDNINSQLYRINQEREQKEGMVAIPQSHSNAAQYFRSSDHPSQNGFGQNNNVNISLTLALGQVQQNGQLTTTAEPVRVQCHGGKRPRSVIIGARVQKQKIESSMQTELPVVDSNANCNREMIQASGTVDSSNNVIQESTSTFPSRIPSESWKKRSASRQKSKRNTNQLTNGWGDFLDFPDFPTVLTYTGHSISAILNVADRIVSNFIIPPDNIFFTQEEMNAGEDQIVISLMRLIGIPQQLRHQIYQEALHDLQAIHDISSGSLDVLNSVIDWLTPGDAGGKEDLMNKARILAAITTEIDPDSEVWRQFERDVSIFSIAVGEVVKEGYEHAKETTRRCSQTLIETISSSLSNCSIISGFSGSKTALNDTSSGLGTSMAKIDRNALTTIEEEETEHNGQVFQEDKEESSDMSLEESVTKDADSQQAHSSASLNLHKRTRGERRSVRQACSVAGRMIQPGLENETVNQIRNGRPLTPMPDENGNVIAFDTKGGSTSAVSPGNTKDEQDYPVFDNTCPSADEGNKDERNQRVRGRFEKKKKKINDIQRESRRFAKMTSKQVHAPPVNSKHEINLGFESSEEHIPAGRYHRQTDEFLEAPDPSMYEDYGITGALTCAAQSITTSFQNVSKFFPIFRTPVEVGNKKTDEPAIPSNLTPEPEPIEQPLVHRESQMPQKLQNALSAAALLLFDAPDSPAESQKEEIVAEHKISTPVESKHVTDQQKKSSMKPSVPSHQELNAREILRHKSYMNNFLQSLKQLEAPKSGIFIKEGSLTPGRTRATVISFGVNKSNSESVASLDEPIRSNFESETEETLSQVSIPAAVAEFHDDNDDEYRSGIRTPVKPATAATSENNVKESLEDIPLSQHASHVSQLLERVQPLWSQRFNASESYPSTPKPMGRPPQHKLSRFLPNKSMPSIPEITESSIIFEGDEEVEDKTKLQKDLCQLEKIVQDLCGEVAGGSPSSSGTTTPPKPSVSFAESHGSITDIDNSYQRSPSRIPRKTYSKSKIQFINPDRSSTIAIYPPKKSQGISCVTMSKSTGNKWISNVSRARISSQSQRCLPLKANHR